MSGQVPELHRGVAAGQRQDDLQGHDKGEVIDAHPDYRAVIKARGGADVITGSNLKATC